MNDKRIKRLVVVGGGTAGWMAAAALARQLRPELYEVSVIESSHINTIGVGESIVPPVVAFIRNLGMNEQDFIQNTQASYKLGIQFRDWLGNGESYFHPFGALGRKLDGHDFLQCWLKARSEGDSSSLMDYAPAAVMAENQRFALPFKLPLESPLAGTNYAFHLDASLLHQYLRWFAEERGVKRINAHVVRVNTAQSGNIESLELNNRQTVAGDFFIDCSGFRGILIDETLSSPYQSWKHFLPCDRAVTVQAAHSGAIPPYTISTARESGWTWRVPLQKRISSGYVFSSDHCSDNQARKTLLDAVEGEPMHNPGMISFRAGMREQLWKKNCIALGLSGGFLEPLESAAIYLVTRGVQLMLELFPDLQRDEQNWPSLAAEYNARMRMDYEEIRDFIILHYCTTTRADTEFWRFCRSNPIPDSLAAKIELFKARGELRIADDSLFQESNWQAVLTGMGVIPRSYHPFIDLVDFNGIRQAMQADRVQMDKAIQALPTYRKFLGE